MVQRNQQGKAEPIKIENLSEDHSTFTTFVMEMEQIFNFKPIPMWWIYAILSALFASLTAIFAKLGVTNVNPNLATGIRTIVVVIMIWLIVFAREEARGIGFLSKQNIVFLIISGIATGLSWLFYFKALQLGKVSQVAPVDKLSVALTILLSVIFLGEVLTLKTAIGACLIILGTIILIF